MRNLILILIFLITYSVVFSQKKYGNKVKKSFITHNLSDKTPLLIIAINANDCINYMLQINALFKKIEALELTNVVYLIDGITNAEKVDYFKKALHTNPTGKTILVDDNLYKNLNQSFNSSIFVVEDGKIKYAELIKSLDPDFIGLQSTLDSDTIKLVDSIKVNADYFRRVSHWDFLDNNKIVTLNSSYHEIKILDLKLDSVVEAKNNKTLNLNVDSVLSFSIKDTSILNYNLWHRRQSKNFFTENPQFPEVQFANLKIQSGVIYLGVNISVVSPYDDESAAISSRIRCVVELSSNLKVVNISIVDLSSFPENYTGDIALPFTFDNNGKLYMRSLYFSEDGIFESAKNGLILKQQGNKFVYEKMIESKLPHFFVEKKFYNNFTSASFFKNNEDIFIYYSYVPTVFNLTKNTEYVIPKTIYKKTKISTSDIKIFFEIQTVFSWGDGGIGVCYKENDSKTHIIFIDKNRNVKSKYLLSKKETYTKIKANEDFIYGVIYRKETPDVLIFHRYRI